MEILLSGGILVRSVQCAVRRVAYGDNFNKEGVASQRKPQLFTFRFSLFT
jgi:hypothetical protein